MGETLSLSYYLGLPAKNVKTEFYYISSEIYSQMTVMEKSFCF